MEKNQHAAYESDLDVKKAFQLKMEENFLELYKELDIEKSESSRMDFSQRIQSKIRKFARKISAQYDSVDHQMVTEIVLLKAKIVEITDEHKIAMSLNAKTMNSIVKMHEKAFDAKTNELANTQQELQSVKVTNQELLQKIQKLETKKYSFANPSAKNLEIKPFACKYCDESFFQVHEVKEHINIHATILEVQNETAILSYDKDCVTDEHSNIVDILGENMDVTNKNQSKIPLKSKHKPIERNDGEQKIDVNENTANLNEDTNLEPKMKIHEGKNDKTFIEQVPYNDQGAELQDEVENSFNETVNEDKKRLKCECGKQFASKKGLQRHKNFVHVKNVFQCDICGLKYSRKDKLKNHKDKHKEKENTRGNIEKILETVSEKKLVTCNECGKQVSCKRALERHENSAHAAVKKTVKCEYCDLELSRKDKLKTHLEKHCKKKK